MFYSICFWQVHKAWLISEKSAPIGYLHDSPKSVAELFAPLLLLEGQSAAKTNAGPD